MDLGCVRADESRQQRVVFHSLVGRTGGVAFDVWDAGGRTPKIMVV